MVNNETQSYINLSAFWGASKGSPRGSTASHWRTICSRLKRLEVRHGAH
jgi:hypothetical protein